MIQLPLYTPKSDWALPNMADLPSWEGAERVAFDLETRDELIGKKMGIGAGHPNCYTVGAAIAIEDGPAFYLPFRHALGDNLPLEAALAYLRDQAKHFSGDLVGANLPYDIQYAALDDITFPKVRRFLDVQVAEPLLDDLQMSYSLNAIAERRDLAGKDEALLRAAAESFRVDPKGGLWKLPAKYVGPYAEQDVRLPLKLMRIQEEEIAEQGIEKIFDLETRLLPALVRMRQRGVLIDWDRMDQVEAWLLAEEVKALKAVKESTGIFVQVGTVWQAEEYARVLRSIGIKVPITPKTKRPSIDKAFLLSLHDDVAGFLLRARAVNKVRTTFVASLRRYQINGRIHCTFNQLRRTDDNSGDSSGARPGRLSSSNPNLQQQPARDEELGPLWRSVYIPDAGGKWLCADYSQQEPRWVTHFAEITRCAMAAEAAEQYRTDPKTDNHQMMTQMIHGDGVIDWPDYKKHRTDCKQTFLGLCYGMGGAKLCKKLGYSTVFIFSERLGRMVERAGPEGQAMLDLFNQRAPYIKQLARKCEEKAKKAGFIRTAGGRRCRFPKDDRGEYDFTHKALNRLIQGSSADQTKMAVVEADAEGIPLQLQVHDELDMTIYSMKEAERLGEIMTSVLPCNVPSVVDLEIGPNWGEVK